MKSDSRETAVWRAFGMLDAGESAAFDEAARPDRNLTDASREIDRISAAIAVVSSRPVPAGAAHLERIRRRIGMGHARRSGAWLAISGWAAALVLGAALWLREDHRNHEDGRVNHVAGANRVAAARVPAPTPAIVSAPPEVQTIEASTPPRPAETQPPQQREARRLVQEIATLRGALQQVDEGERALFQPVPGIAVPVVMRMAPPDARNAPRPTVAPAGISQDPPVSTFLADVFARGRDTGKTPASPHDSAASSAIPIYDAARDLGTLVVSDLPALQTGKVYNLWFTTGESGSPIHIGHLPELAGTSGAEAIDFSLGARSILPTGFILTRDTSGRASAPAPGNIVLQGPAMDKE